VDEVSLGQDCIRILRYFSSHIIPPLLHAFLHLHGALTKGKKAEVWQPVLCFPQNRKLWLEKFFSLSVSPGELSVFEHTMRRFHVPSCFFLPVVQPSYFQFSTNSLLALKSTKLLPR
jgi:hypothetical protein